MQNKKFTWDENKHRINKRKHGISFEEASTVFDDDKIIFGLDANHSNYEDRFIAIGMSQQPRLLIVCHCYRNGGSIIRIISARKATKSEEAEYRRQ